MRIGIDFDNTLDRDPDLWREFVKAATARGHSVVCVTQRRTTEENLQIVEDWMSEKGLKLPVFFTSLQSKVEYMKNADFPVDIWIDDDPKRCALGWWL